MIQLVPDEESQGWLRCTCVGCGPKISGGGQRCEVMLDPIYYYLYQGRCGSCTADNQQHYQQGHVSRRDIRLRKQTLYARKRRREKKNAIDTVLKDAELQQGSFWLSGESSENYSIIPSNLDKEVIENAHGIACVGLKLAILKREVTSIHPLAMIVQATLYQLRKTFPSENVSTIVVLTKNGITDVCATRGAVGMPQVCIINLGSAQQALNVVGQAPLQKQDAGFAELRTWMTSTLTTQASQAFHQMPTFDGDGIAHAKDLGAGHSKTLSLY